MMQDDIFPAAEKILFDIESVVKKNPSLKGFEIVPAEDNENKSPVFHQEEYLGLASWCVQPLYCYAYRQLLELRQNRHKREEPNTVSRWLLGALLLNPDISTFWNMRRELVRCRKLDPTDEISFSRLVLYHKPKCFEAFAYRRWLLPFVLDIKETSYNAEPAISPLCAEIEVAGTCANRYANNYHAWSHRRYVMALKESQGYVHPTFDSEWRDSLVWCQQHVSDHSGLVYRQFLLKKCLVECKEVSRETLAEYTDTSSYGKHCSVIASYIQSSIAEHEEDCGIHNLLQINNISPTNFLNIVHGKGSVNLNKNEPYVCVRALSYWIEECKINEDAIRHHSGHEALWCHRRFLAYILAQLTISYNKYSCYKVDFLDLPTISEGDEKVVDNQTSRCLLEKAFRIRNSSLVELAKKRNQHEKKFAESFLKIVDNINLEVFMS